MKRIIKILFCFLLIFSVGCWDESNLQNVYLIFGIGVDVCKEDEEKVKITFTSPTVEESAPEDIIGFTEDVSGLREAMEHVQSKSGKLVQISYGRIMIFEEEMAKRGVLQYLRAIERDARARDYIALSVYKEKTKDLLNIKFSSSAYTALWLYSVLEYSNDRAITPLTTARVFLNEYHRPGIEPSMSYISRVEGNNGVVADSTAIFIKDQFKGVLEKDDSMVFLFMKGNTYKGIHTIEMEKGKSASILVRKGKRDIKTTLEGGTLHIKETIHITADLQEYAETQKAATKQIENINKAFEKDLEKISKEVLKHLQKEYISDAVGYGEYVRIQQPDFFDEKNWNAQFSEAKIEVDFVVNIKRIGTLT